MHTKTFTHTKKFYVHEIAAVDLSKIYFLKNAKKTCKPNNHDLNRDWIRTRTTKFCSFLIDRQIFVDCCYENDPQFSYFIKPIIGQNSDSGISNYRISGQSFIKENCHNSRNSDDIDMKHGPVTKLDRRNKTTSKKFDVYIMSENCDVIVIFQIFGQFGAVRRPDSGKVFCKSYVFSNSNLLSYRNWKQN